MNSLFIYLFESSVCLLVFYFFFWLFLSRDTFFSRNRYYLLGAIILSLTIPLLSSNFKVKTHKKPTTPINLIIELKNGYNNNFVKEINEIHHFPAKYSMLSQELYIKKMANLKMGRKIFILKLSLLIYYVGFIIFLSHFIIGIIRLVLIILKSRIKRENGINIVFISDTISPFSFFNFIFINSSTQTDNEYTQIILHEKGHITQFHSYDLILLEALTIILWFNPITWKYKKSMRLIHECLADKNVIQQGFNLNKYQSIILKQCMNLNQIGLTNNFSLPILKRRLSIMAQSKSSNVSQLKLFLFFPILALVCIFLTTSGETPDTNKLILRVVCTDSTLTLCAKSGCLPDVRYTEYHKYVSKDDNYSFVIRYSPLQKVNHPLTGRTMTTDELKEIYLYVVNEKNMIKSAFYTKKGVFLTKNGKMDISKAVIDLNLQDTFIEYNEFIKKTIKSGSDAETVNRPLSVYDVVKNQLEIVKMRYKDADDINRIVLDIKSKTFDKKIDKLKLISSEVNFSDVAVIE